MSGLDDALRRAQADMKARREAHEEHRESQRGYRSGAPFEREHSPFSFHAGFDPAKERARVVYLFGRQAGKTERARIYAQEAGISQEEAEEAVRRAQAAADDRLRERAAREARERRHRTTSGSSYVADGGHKIFDPLAIETTGREVVRIPPRPALPVHSAE